jgi:ketosteroid isomerase-like protein
MPEVLYDEISPGFFASLRVPVVAGREFDDRDGPASPPVALVNEALALRLWPGAGNPLGRTILLGGREVRVVGVVANHNPRSAAEAPPSMAFVPFWQNLFHPQIDARLAVRVRGDPAATLPALRRAVAGVDAAVPVTEALAFFDGMVKSGAIKKIALETTEVFDGNDTAAEVGKYTVLDGKGQAVDSGKYIVVWKTDGGKWKLHRDTWNSDAKPPAAAPPAK